MPYKASACNNCPLHVHSKPSTSYGGNTNISTWQNTKAFRYAHLVSLAARSQNSGTNKFIVNYNAYAPIQPPKNTF